MAPLQSSRLQARVRTVAAGLTEEEAERTLGTQRTLGRMDPARLGARLAELSAQLPPQVVRKLVPKAAVVGIDLLPVDPIGGVTLFEMDFMDDKAPQLLRDALGDAPDLVISDMAANTVGHPQTDHLRTMALVEAAAWFAVENLRKGGTFVAKVFAGGTDGELLVLLKKNFTTIKHAKPPASRKGSVEWYVVAQGFKGRPDEPARDRTGAPIAE